MATQQKTERAAPLSREAVLTTALAVADTEGLDAVSFRRVAAGLGVTPMALYRYVSSKEELLAGMMDLVFSQFEIPEPQTDWREELREFGRSFRRLLLSHPAAAPLYFTKSEGIFLHGLRIIESMLELLQRAGFSPEQAALIQGSLERTVLALVLFEAGDASRGSAEEMEAHIRTARARLQSLPPREFPRVIGAVDVLCGAVDPDAAFEFALDLMSGGLERLLGTS